MDRHAIHRLQLCSILMMMLVGLFGCMLGSAATNNIESGVHTSPFAPKLDIIIYTKDAQSEWKSELWPMTLEATMVDGTSATAAIDGIIAAMGKYPVDVIDRHITRVFIVDRLTYDNAALSGYNVSSDIAIARRGRLGLYSRATVERVFHKEFSSVLLRSHREAFPEAEWMAANPSAFEYWGGSREAIKMGRMRTLRRNDMLQDGFLYEYAQSSLTNDFNAIAGELFSNGIEFWKQVEKSERLLKKVNCAVQFFSLVDGRMTAEFFLSLPRCDGDEITVWESWR